MIDIAECSNDPRIIAEKICDSDECHKLGMEAREIFPDYNSNGEVTCDAAEWIVERLVNQVQALDELPDDVTNKIIDHMFDSVMEGLT